MSDRKEINATLNIRAVNAFNVRTEAALLAFSRGQPEHESNGEETSIPSLAASFTKGLAHDPQTGLILDPGNYEAFREAVESGYEKVIRKLPLGPDGRSFESAMAQNPAAGLRAWESMGAGLTYDLEGPDAQAVTMPPAPTLDSDELAFEMTEVYNMALLRDVPFTEFSSGGNELVEHAIEALNAQPFASQDSSRQRTGMPVTGDNLFRGSLRGDESGPYISQFLLAGTQKLTEEKSLWGDGRVLYGAIQVDQRVQVAVPGREYLTSWGAWLDAQDAADVRGRESYVKQPDENGTERPQFRCITTPRDLATYVHYDALYQAYLNACLILLALGVPFDKGLPFTGDDDEDKQSGFATFGGPHVLSLVTEVATRALKAVRFQKYNIHRRARPEAIAALVDGCKRQECQDAFEPAAALAEKLDDATLELIFEKNKEQNAEQEDNGTPRSQDFDPVNGTSSDGTYLLPMAFPEGSPMHPSYGAGHATVAGACVTVLKAFFEGSYELEEAFVPSGDGTRLEKIELDEKLRVGGELNKVCSNISIGRNWAGVHYYSDYIESVTMGEEIAIGIMQEQMLTFGEDVSMVLRKFNGEVITITR